METESFDTDEIILRDNAIVHTNGHIDEEGMPLPSIEEASGASIEFKKGKPQAIPTALQDASRRYVTNNLEIHLRSGGEGRVRAPGRHTQKRARSKHLDISSDSDREIDIVKAYLGQVGAFKLLTKEEEVVLSSRLRAGREAAAKMVLDGLRVLNGFEPMYSTEERAPEFLIDGLKAKDHFINANLRLVVSIAKRYTASGMPLIDLIQEGNLGLEHAVDMFDERKGFKFSTYASWWIRQRISRSIVEKKDTVRLPHRSSDFAPKVMMAYKKNQSIEQIADATGLGQETVRGIILAASEMVSLDETISEDTTTTRGDQLADPKSDELLREVENTSVITNILPVLHELFDEREFDILLLRQGFGTPDGEPMTLSDIGKKYEIGRERVRQIEARIMSRLRHPSIVGRLGSAALY